MERDAPSADEGLARRLTTGTLTLYGVGVIVGAGIYVLVGEVAGEVGDAVWLGFLLAAVAALPTGLSYASLASRHPRSAGEAVFAERAFGRPLLAFVVGYLVLASGVSSTAAVSHGFASYLGALVELPAWADPVVLVGFLAALSAVNYRGMEESMWLNGVCTVVSVGALVVLVAAGADRWGAVDAFDPTPPGGGTGGWALLSGAALAFYAFIGFEDICNVAEEVHAPQRTIPRAIALAVALVSVIYVAVGLTVVAAVPPAELAASETPLVLVAQRLLPSWPTGWLSAVALFAVTNTALFNLIMGSRILYGMARQGWVPPLLGRVHPKRRTPTVGVWLVFGLAAAAALTGFLRVLAEATNVIILLVFFSVNVSLLAIRAKRVPPDDPEVSTFDVPWVVPLVGAAITAYLVAQFSPGAYLRAGVLAASGALLYGLARLRRAPDR
ncbi:MAG TPA: APC family permease [Sandaracinaceae bacterium LLY-WYZ-13_1]|nr:APC family permease [Sandaracinaceae bacterium LLY-WYZ-13_1]